MKDKKISTTMTDIIKHIKDDPIKAAHFIDALEQTIPVKTKKRIPKVDTNLNNTFLIKRLGCSVEVDILRVDPQLSIYEAKIKNIICLDGKTSHFNSGDTLFISKRELELTGKVIH